MQSRLKTQRTSRRAISFFFILIFIAGAGITTSASASAEASAAALITDAVVVPTPTPDVTATPAATPTDTPDATATPAGTPDPSPDGSPSPSTGETQSPAPDATAAPADTPATAPDGTPDITFPPGVVLPSSTPDNGETPGGEPTPEPPPPEKGFFTGYWWVLLIIVIAVAAAAAVLVYLLKFKGTAVTGVPNPRTRPPSVQSSDGLPIGIGNAHGIGGRDYQQDSFGISDISNTELVARKGIFGIMADGMGGMADGAEVSNIVVRTMIQYFNEVSSSGKAELDLLNMLYAANDNVNKFMKGREKGGSTVVAAIIHGGKMYWISVGDSRIYLYRSGELMQLNREHIYGVELDEKAATGEISWEKAATDSRRGALTSYIGIGKLEKVDRNTNPVPLLPGDRILLMSDGVFGTLSDAEIRDTMLLPPPEAANALHDGVVAKQKPNQDNFTAVVLEYRG